MNNIKNLLKEFKAFSMVSDGLAMQDNGGEKVKRKSIGIIAIFLFIVFSILEKVHSIVRYKWMFSGDW